MNNYALEYYLDSIIPKGALIGLLFPKSKISSVVPKIARAKNCRILGIGLSASSRKDFAGIIASSGELKDCDIFLAEPDLIHNCSAIVPKEESIWLSKFSVVGVGIPKQKYSIPKNHDVIQLKKVVNENGVFNPNHITFS